MMDDTIILDVDLIYEVSVTREPTRYGTWTRTLSFKVARRAAFPDGPGNLRAPYLRVEPRSSDAGGLWNIATLTVESRSLDHQVLLITAVSEEVATAAPAEESVAEGSAAADVAASPRRPPLVGRAEDLPARRRGRGTRADVRERPAPEAQDPADALAARLNTHNEPVDLGLVRFVSENGPRELTCEYLPGRDGALGRVRINTGDGAYLEVALRPFLNTLIEADRISQRPVTDTRPRRTLGG